MRVGDSISMSVTDFIKLAPRGLVLHTTDGSKLHYSNGNYMFDSQILYGCWGKFTPPTEPVPEGLLPPGFDDPGEFSISSRANLRVVQLPTLTAIRRP